MRKIILPAGVVALAALAGGAFVFWQQQPPAGVEPPRAAADGAATGAPGEAVVEVPVAVGEMILGDPEAPVTIVEYASLTCDHCGAFHRDTLPRLKAEWIDTGKARLVYRDFPLNAPALQAAMLARCAAADGGGQQRYFAFVGALFQTQESWAHAQDPTAALGQVAALGGVGAERFRTCLADKGIEDAVLIPRLEGERYGIASTPTFFIDGRKLEGARPYAEFEELLNAAAADGAGSGS